MPERYKKESRLLPALFKYYICKLLLLIIPWILNQVGIGIKLIPVDGEERSMLTFHKHVTGIVERKNP
jgi:hypothetical protein